MHCRNQYSRFERWTIGLESYPGSGEVHELDLAKSGRSELLFNNKAAAEEEAERWTFASAHLTMRSYVAVLRSEVLTTEVRK